MNRKRTNKVCVQMVIDQINKEYKTMLWEVREIQISNDIKYNEAKKIWLSRNPNANLKSF